MGVDLVDFIYKSNESADVQELTGHLLGYLKTFGLDQFVMSDMAHDSTSQKETYHGMLVNYPESWMKHYVDNHYIDHDPVYQTALTSRKPFTWHEVRNGSDLSLQAVQVMNEANEAKLYDGIGLSLHLPMGRIIGMGFSGSERGIECNKNVLSLVYAAANQFFTVYADLNNMYEMDPGTIHLTNREREVLLWMARGKTKQDIGDILMISASCVKRHCESIYAKLHTNSNTFAVTKALRMGLIKPF